MRKNIGEEEKTERKWQDYLIEAVIRGYIKPKEKNQNLLINLSLRLITQNHKI